MSINDEMDKKGMEIKKIKTLERFEDIFTVPFQLDRT